MSKGFIISLALNGVLAAACGTLLLRPVQETVTVSPELTLGAAADAPESVEFPLPETVAESPVERAEASVVRPSSVLDELDGLGHEEQVAALVAAGWESEDAKVYTLGRVMRGFVQQMQRMVPEGNQDYWRSPSMDMSMSWEEQRKLVEMQHDMQAVLEDLSGGESLGMFGQPSIPIPREKARAAALIEMDYQMMQGKLHSDTGGIMLPEDQKALELLEEEKQRDLEAMLSPEELFEYEIRTSSTAMSLRHELDVVEPTEEEFRTLYKLKRELEEMRPDPEVNDLAVLKPYQDAQEAMEDEMRATLGEERYRQYERSKDWSYGRLIAVTERLDLPRERVDQVYDVREYMESRQAALHAEDLSEEERQVAIETLATETEEELSELLGDEGLELYKQNGGNWLNHLR